MHPTDFDQRNTIFAENQPEYLPLPAYRFPADAQGRVLFCWKLSWKERIKIIFTGKVWQQALTFNEPLQPQLLTAENPLNEPPTAGV